MMGTHERRTFAGKGLRCPEVLCMTVMAIAVLGLAVSPALVSPLRAPGTL